MRTRNRSWKWCLASAILLVFTVGGTAYGAEEMMKVWPDRLRGFCVGKPGPHLTEERIFKRLASWRVNALTVNFTYDSRLDIEDVSGLPAVPPAMEPYRGALDRLDKIIALAKKHGIYIVLAGGGALGNDKINVATGETTEENAAQERAYLANVIALHEYLGPKYRNEPTILAYNFISEPHTPWIVENWRTEVVPPFIKAIRAVDPNTYLIFSAGLWGFPDFGGKGKGRVQEPFPDPADKTLYGWHDYAPHNYTHQGVGKRPRNQVYPGMLKMFNGSQLKRWDRDAQAQYMAPAIAFMKKHKVKMFVGEFGVTRWAPGADKWLGDKVSLFEEYGVSWTCHNFAGSWDGWNVTVPAAAKGGNVPDGETDTPRLEALQKYLKQNTTFNK
jgi:endoglucanase